MNRRDLERLRAPLLLAVILALLAVAVAYQAVDAGSAAAAAYRQAQARHGVMEQRLRRLDGEREEIARQGRLYRHLQETGLIGEERRLDWGELMQALALRLQLPALGYQFAAPRALDGSANPGFRASAMQLHLDLFHEEELIDFLAALQREAGALVLVRSCKLARRPAGAGEQLAGLRAQCELDWITLQEPGA